MAALDFLLYLAAGRLVMWMLQIASPIKVLLKLPGCFLRFVFEAPDAARKVDDFTEEFLGCDLCLGFWVYLSLALLWRPEQSLSLWPYEVEMVVLVMLSTLLAHLLRLGWQSKFGTLVLTD